MKVHTIKYQIYKFQKSDFLKNIMLKTTLNLRRMSREGGSVVNFLHRWGVWIFSGTTKSIWIPEDKFSWISEKRIPSHRTTSMCLN